MKNYAIGLLDEYVDEREQQQSRLDYFAKKVGSLGELGWSDSVWEIRRLLEVQERLEKEEFCKRSVCLKEHLFAVVGDLVAEGD